MNSRMSTEENNDISKLELLSVVGFAGAIPNGLLVHPDRQHLIYALGSTVIVENLESKSQTCLSGHTDEVTCIAVSKSGRYLASGQKTHMGFKADIIVWDYEECKLYLRLTLHKVKVEALAFSPNDKYLVSLGGQDDGSVVLWDLEKKEAVCGSPAAVPSAGTTYAVAFANDDDKLFFTGGNKTLRIWSVDLENRKIRPTDCNMGQLKRIVHCIQVADDDQHFFCGTSSGDILKVIVKSHLLKEHGPAKDKFSQGVKTIQILKTGDLLIGCGDGTVAIVKDSDKREKLFRKTKSAKVEGGVSSIALRGNGHQFLWKIELNITGNYIRLGKSSTSELDLRVFPFDSLQFFIGTSCSYMYKFNYDDFTYERVNMCHYGRVNDIVFPYQYSDLFATCAKNEIRVWNTNTSKELMRIEVPNMTCNAIAIMRDGKSIISGWDDGKIRSFTPQRGKLKYEINDAHSKGVTALATTSDCLRIISGGGEGEVRVWDIHDGERPTTKLYHALKEHKGSVTCIRVRVNDRECISASTDGTCIIWNLERMVRHQIVFANTMFKAVCYNHEENQVITGGTDRKIAYWETYDGSQIRELEGSKSGSIEGLDISPDGFNFVSGGSDKLIKVWGYNEGKVTHVGTGHSGDIVRIKVCPTSKFIISVSADGAILKWKYPY